MSAAISFWPFAAIFLALLLILDSRRKKRSALPYPPGPRGRFFVGNLHDIPAIKPWKVYRNWGKIYGDPVGLNVSGQNIIVVNSRKLADELFEKRSQVYSDRPDIPMLILTKWGIVNAGLMRYSQRWRMSRRVFTQGFRAATVPNYQSILTSKTSQLLTSLRETPESFAAHIKTYAAASILATLYGHDVALSHDWLVDLVEETVGTLSDVLHPGTLFILEVLPFLRHLPLQLPIFKFQRVARRTRRLLDKMRNVPYEMVKNDMETGKGKFSLLGELLEHHAASNGDEEQLVVIKDAIMISYAAGVETSLSSLVTFFLAMAIHPEIQKRAQNDLDTVVGRERLPTYADRGDLPYVEAIFRETLRWSPPLPLGVAHAALSDDVVDGKFIPKGTTVIGNIWAITRDEAIYPDPESFKPERFLNVDGTCNDDTMLTPFGFGRRICAGRHFASLTVWMAMASFLSQFNIEQPEDEEGKPIKCLADINYSDGLFSHADRFRCVITPRAK